MGFDDPILLPGFGDRGCDSVMTNLVTFDMMTFDM
jgi:hypothetical protein